MKRNRSDAEVAWRKAQSEARWEARFWRLLELFSAPTALLPRRRDQEQRQPAQQQERSLP